MNAAVRYYTMTGHTARLADAIAQAIGVKAETIDVPIDQADVLFIGGAIYAGTIAAELREFISTLDPAKIGRAAIFTSSSISKRGFSQIKSELEKRGIAVEPESFYCRGQFKFMLRGRPDGADCAAAADFAKKTARIQ